MCETAVLKSFIIPTIYTRGYRGNTVPINFFFPFLFCSILNKIMEMEMEDVSLPHLSLSPSRREKVRCIFKIHHRLSL